MPLMAHSRRFCSKEYDGISWEQRDAIIRYGSGGVVFQQKGVDVPKGWSDQALNIVAQKYLRGYVDKEGNAGPGRETSVRQLIDRVVETIAGWAGFRLEEGEPAPDGWTKVKVEQTSDGQQHEYQEGAVTREGAIFYRVAHKRPADSLQPRQEVYFQSRADWEAWKDDLKQIVVEQRFCFNSPVWFNVGVDDHPQCSACFIVRMEDYFTTPGVSRSFDPECHGIINAQVKETIIFANGSGSGLNLSRLRSDREFLSGGGRASGPLSFARGLDSWATVVKSGGKTRRAAKMLVMDVDHPNIRDFVHVKAKEERIAKTLIAAGYASDMDGEAYQHAFHQNSNLSARVSDAFMRAVEARGQWPLISRSSHHLSPDLPTALSMVGIKGKTIESVSAYDLMHEISQSCWESGDPGMQFSDTINEWHTCAETEPIFATNPCSEYCFLDETACNLASLNLAKFLKADKTFDADAFSHAVRVGIIAMETLVSNSKYPTANFARMSHKYRTLGIGYANLGGMLMRMGLGYDSDEARFAASVVSSLLCSRAYETSAEMACCIGPFPAYRENSNSVLHVMRRHKEAHQEIRSPKDKQVVEWLSKAKHDAASAWGNVEQACVETLGIRNAQATVIAPTGTIAFMMDCETTGIEPELGLVKYKVLAGGGTLKMVNPLVEEIVSDLGQPLAADLLAHLRDGKSPRTWAKSNNQASLSLASTSWSVLKTSFPPVDDPEFCIPWRAHIEMMAAVQPFISGAISKTVNMPESSTTEDIMGAYTLAWHRGLKCVAIYRDNCKAVQPLSTTAGKADGGGPIETVRAETDSSLLVGARKKLGAHVASVRCKFKIESHKGYLHVGFYEDTWDVAEIFVNLSKLGSSVRGFADQFCRLFSICLQYGVTFEELYEGTIDTTFEPNGIVVDDPDVRSCRSIPDYVVQKVQALVGRAKRTNALPTSVMQEPVAPFTRTMTFEEKVAKAVAAGRPSGKVCARCGGMRVLMLGKCYFCTECNHEEGGCFA
jgi:ribonucleoside-diphosphate reductase alpha chain